MGTSRSIAEFNKKMALLAGQIGNTDPALIELAEQGKAIFRASAAQAGALNVKLSGKRRPIGVRDDFIRYRASGEKAVIVSYTGPAHILNNDTKAHRIYRNVGTARGRGSRRLNRQASLAATFGATGAFTGGALKFSGNAGDTFRKVVDHPGTKGKKFYEKARATTERVVPPLAGRKLLTAPLRKVIG